jgi:hypothetical protein
MTDLGWYNDRYSRFTDDATCEEAIQYIGEFLSYYNDIYDRNLQSQSITTESPKINKAQNTIDELKLLV